MFKKISNSFMPVLTWAGVITTTVLVVVSMQAYGDNQASNQTSSDTSTSLDSQNQIVVQEKAAHTNAQTVWSPRTGFADLIEKVSPAVVHVAISGKVKSRAAGPEFNFPPGSPFEDFFKEFRKRKAPQQKNKPQKSRPLGIGSGFIISADGYVVTNNHVVKGADEIVVALTDGTEYQAQLKGTDTKTDLALLKLEKASNLPFVPWGDDDKSRVGDWVLAIGNPFGLGGSATTGIISARGRDIRSGPYDDYIQVDAAINRGNSGGPLFNLNGEVIGINTAIYSPNGGSVGIGFSIPSGMAKNVISQLQAKGEVERAWIGVEIQELNKELAEGFERKDDDGALIASVVPGKPADKSGLQAGDIILSFDGKEIEEMRDLPRVVAESKVGSKYKMKVWRNGKTKTLTIQPDKYPDDLASLSSGNSDSSSPQNEESDLLGATLGSMSDEVRERFKIDDEQTGVVIVGITNEEGLAAQNGLKAGDIIAAIDNAKVTTVEEVIERITNAQKANRSKIVMLLQRGQSSRFIPFDLVAE